MTLMQIPITSCSGRPKILSINKHHEVTSLFITQMPWQERLLPFALWHLCHFQTAQQVAPLS